jgi:hypothetical protein
MGGLVIIGSFVHRIYKLAKRIDDALGVDAEGRSISDRLSRVEHQLFPNGGSSLTDKMNRIEADQHKMRGKMEAMQSILDSILTKLKEG